MTNLFAQNAFSSSGISGLGTGVATWLGAPTVSNLNTALGATVATASGTTTGTRYLRDDNSWQNIDQPLGPVGTRATCIDDGAQSNGTDTTCTSRRQHYITQTCSDLRLLFTNTYNTTAPIANPYTITVKAAIEDSSGNIWPLYFNGSRTVSLAPGAHVFTDPLPMVFAAGDYVRSRVNVTVASGDKWPRWAFYSNGIDTFQAGVDYTDSGTLSGTNGYCFTTNGVYGRPLGSKGLCAVIGDSIAYGSGSNSTWNSFIIRAFGSNYGKNVSYATLATPGETAQNFINQVETRYRLMIINGCTTALVELGTNDVMQNHRTAAQVEADLTTLYARLASLGIRRIYQTTITPRTTSTDSWATTTNQTTSNSTDESNRRSINAWIRANTAGIAGYFEVTDIVETARDSGIWKAGTTADGIHPNDAMHASMAAAIAPSYLSNP
jgi:lysophospholipase L1-like esterase